MNKLFLVTLLFSMLLLSACTGVNGRGFSSTPLVDYYVGTEGVMLEFVQGTPPADTNEGQNFDVQVLVHNLGAYDLIDDKKISLELVHDSALISEFDVAGQSNYLEKPFTLRLHGKSYAFSNGEQDFFSVGRYRAREVRSSFETTNPSVYATLCYPYQTSFAKEVCVDTDITNTDVRAQACETEPSYTFPRGQGAPIAVTKLETTFDASGPYARPAFKFTIKNVGDGFFHQGPADSCSVPTVDTMYKVDFSAILGNDSLECPDEVFLKDGEAEVNCFLPGEGILLTRSNYMSLLTAQINYQYTQTFAKSFTVKRQQQYSLDNSFGTGACAPWDIFDVGTQKCISRCEYCANTTDAEGCLSANSLVTDPTVKKTPLPKASCVYTKTECTTAGDNCLDDEGVFCVPGLYCGVPECAYNAKRNSAPTVGLEPGADETKVTWYCSDKENNVNLQSACGCVDTSSFAVTAKGVACPDAESSYTQVQGHISTSLKKTYFTVDRSTLGEDVSAVCVRVVDQQGKTATKKLVIS